MGWVVKFNDTEVTGIRNVNISESVLFNNSVGTITPRTATFESFLNESDIYTNMQYSYYIADRMISSYFVELYLDEIIRFTGYIDVTKCKYNKKEDIITVFCYDYIELFNVYSDYVGRKIYGGIKDVAHYNYFLSLKTHISNQIGKTLTHQDDISTPASDGTRDVNRILIPLQMMGYQALYGQGFCTPEVGSTILYVMYSIGSYGDGTWGAYVKIHRYFPGYGYVLYNEWTSGDPVDTPETEEWLEEIDKVLASAGIDRDTYLASLSLSGWHSDRNFERTWFDITHIGQTIHFDFFFGTQCEKPVDDQILLKNDSNGLDQHSYIEIIKDILLLNRATIVAKDDGVIVLRNLEQELVTHNITQGILSFYTTIIDTELNVNFNHLSGYQEYTKEITEGIYDDYFGVKKILEITIDNLDSHDIHVSNVLNVYNNNYIVKSVKRDYKKDEYEIIGWKI